MKRKIIIIIPYISLLIIIIGIVIYQNTIINRQKLLLSKYKIQDSTLLSMMIEDENGDYAESENSEWPG